MYIYVPTIEIYLYTTLLFLLYYSIISYFNAKTDEKRTSIQYSVRIYIEICCRPFRRVFFPPTLQA